MLAHTEQAQRRKEKHLLESRHVIVRINSLNLRLFLRCRRSGLGAMLLRHVMEEGRRRGANVAQFTSNKARQEAHMFYERMGFKASHDGYKISLKA